MRPFRVKAALWILLVSIAFQTGCQAPLPLSQPDFPLSEEDIVAAVEAQELNWTIGQREQDETADHRTVYGLVQPESGKNFSTIFVSTFQTEEIGRGLNMTLSISRDQLHWPLEEPHNWDEWKNLLKLSAQLYGGFEDDEEIYHACAATELPLEETLLWNGTLTGGYCRVRASKPIQNWSPFIGGGMVFYIFIDIFESEDSYRIFTEENV